MSDQTSESLIEIGIIIAGPLDDVDRGAAKLASEKTCGYLASRLPEFQFVLLINRRPELTHDGRAQPSILLQQAAEDRDARHWDFVFVLTASELVGNYSPFCFAALSRPLDAAVISMSLIDPQTTNENAQSEERVERIAHRSSRLMLHSLGHLTGLSPDQNPSNLLFHPVTASEIDAMCQLDSEQLQIMRAAIKDIADQRLEELMSGKTRGLSFALRAAWINRREIIEAVIGAKPWEFPRRLSRLTIASVSTVAILLMTAESWDLALKQPVMRIGLLSLLSLLTTTVYVVVRQQLLVRRGRRHTEQTVVTSASALMIVMVGMAITWVTLLMIGVLFAWLLFDAAIVVAWASSSNLTSEAVGFLTIVQMSCFSASLGLLIGALGASFESQHYFRHIIFVDEEV